MELEEKNPNSSEEIPNKISDPNQEGTDTIQMDGNLEGEVIENLGNIILPSENNISNEEEPKEKALENNDLNKPPIENTTNSISDQLINIKTNENIENTENNENNENNENIANEENIGKDVNKESENIKSENNENKEINEENTKENESDDNNSVNKHNEEEENSRNKSGNLPEGEFVQESDSANGANEEDKDENDENDENGCKCKCSTNKTQPSTTNNTTLMIMQFTPVYSDEEVESGYKALMKHNKIPDPAMFPQLLQILFREKTEALDAQDYDRAKTLEEAIAAINKENDSLAYESSYESQNRYLIERESRLQSKLRECKAKYKAKFERHFENCEFRLRQLREKHQREINELKAKYQDPLFLRQFNRPSQQLLNLRRAERKLALAKKYEEARRTKRIADQLQNKEEQGMQDQTHQSMQSEYLKLIDHQQQEMSKMVAFDKKTETEIEAAKIKELFPIETALKQTSVRKADSDCKHSLPASRGYNPVFAREVVAKNQSVATPRTMQKLKQIRDQNVVELYVAPIKNSTFSRLENINKRRVKSILPKL